MDHENFEAANALSLPGTLPIIEKDLVDTGVGNDEDFWLPPVPEPVQGVSAATGTEDLDFVTPPEIKPLHIPGESDETEQATVGIQASPNAVSPEELGKEHRLATPKKRVPSTAFWDDMPATVLTSITSTSATGSVAAMSTGGTSAFTGFSARSHVEAVTPASSDAGRPSTGMSRPFSPALSQICSVPSGVESRLTSPNARRKRPHRQGNEVAADSGSESWVAHPADVSEASGSWWPSLASSDGERE